MTTFHFACAGTTSRTTLPRRIGILLAALALMAALPASAREMVSVKADMARMRAGSSTQQPVLFELAQGYPLEVTGRKGRWVHVRDFEKDRGWVYRSLLGKQPHVIVKARTANVRSGPSTSSPVIGKAGYGEVLKTVEHRDTWVRVQRDSGKKGWIARTLVWGW